MNSGLYFVQDENNFIYPLLLVGSGWPKINGFNRIRILIPVYKERTSLSSAKVYNGCPLPVYLVREKAIRNINVFGFLTRLNRSIEEIFYGWSKYEFCAWRTVGRNRDKSDDFSLIQL